MKDDTNDAELENNVGRLLKSAAAPPRIDPAARDRIKGALLLAQSTRSAATAPATRAAAVATLRATKPAPVAIAGGDASTLSSRRLRRVGVAGLGALAIAAGIALYVGGSGTPPTVAIAPVVFENEGPGPREVVLRDGSKATLDVGAKLVERAPTDVELVAGQAVFEVGRTPAPLGVTTETGAVLASSARFWIRAGKEGAEVAVARGRASLTSKAGARARVRAGEEAVMRAAGVTPVAAPRVSHLFGFARSTNPDAAAAAALAPSRRGTLVGRDPTWGREAPVDLRAFTVDVVVEDGFARTTIDQTYFNPRARQIEGQFAFPVPHGAALSRLAMYVDGQRMEAAVVDRSRARDIYEGIVHQRRDPALLEWMGADNFDMRIFPLPPRTEKRVLFSYTAALEHLYDQDRLVVPIPDVDQAAGAASFRVRIVGGADKTITSPSHVVRQEDDGRDRLVTFDASSYALGQDFVLDVHGDRETVPVARAFDADGARFVRVTLDPHLERAAPSIQTSPAPRSVAVLFDVSASRSESDLAAGARFVDGLLDAIDADDTVSIVAVGHRATVMPGGAVRVADVDRAAVAAFLRGEGRGVGDSRLDLGIAAANTALADATGDRQILYVGDGTAVAVGKDAAATRADTLAAAVAPGTRFIGVGVGDGVDRGALEALSSATGGFTITVGETEDLSARAFDVVATTYTLCLTKLAADVVDAHGDAVPGAVAELASRSVCDGEHADVVARVPAAAARAPLSVRVFGVVDGKAWTKTVALDGAVAGAAYLPRVFAERRVRSLVATAGGLADTPIDGLSASDKETVDEISALAKKQFLVTPFTSLLVLENDAMYASFGLERKAPTGWAVYAAPDRVPVVTEPLGSSGIAVDGSWDVLERSPDGLVGDVPSHAWFGASNKRTGDLSRTKSLDDIQTIGTTGLRIRDTDGFGSGEGRLVGAHRSAAAGPAKRKIAERQWIGAISGTGEGGGGRLALDLAPDPRAADAPRTISQTLLPDLAPVVGATDDWMERAFAGARIEAASWSDDPRLADLTAYAPSMFTDAFDRLSDALAADDAPRPSTQSPDARALLDRALAASPAASVTFASAERGSIVTRPMADGGGFQRTRVLPTGLEEMASFEDGAIRVAYPELAIETTRAPGITSILWLLREAPMVLPPRAVFDALDLELVDAQTIRVRVPVPTGTSKTIAESVPSIEIGFGTDLQIDRVAWVNGASRREARVERTASSVTVRFTDDPSAAVTFTVGAAGTIAPDDAGLVHIALPLRNPATDGAGAVPAGRTPEESARIERQKVAAYVALQDDAAVLVHLGRVDAALGGLTRGDLALGSRALSAAIDRGDDAAKKLVARAAAGTGGKADPIRVFVERGGKGKTATGAGPLVGFVADYRAMLKWIDTAPTAAFPKALAAFRARHPDARRELYVLARTASDAIGWQDGRIAIDTWDALSGDAVLAPIVDRQWAWATMGEPGTSSKVRDARLVAAIDAAVERGWPLALDWRDVGVIREGRGEMGLAAQVAKWRDAILTGRRASQIASLLDLTTNTYLAASAHLELDAGRMVRALDGSVGVDDDLRVQAVDALLARGLRAEANVLLDTMLARPGGPSIAALELRASLAAEAGKLEEAASLYDQLLVQTAGLDMDLDVARAWYATLIELHLRRAGLATGPAADAALGQAFAAADRWRHEDPGNDTIDELCARALYGLGRKDDADAFVAGIVDRRPLDGDAWGKAAELYEKQWSLDDALGAWARAAAVEPTNPTWLLRQASLLRARGQGGDVVAADALLKRIRDGKWQPRFASVVYQASPH